MTAPLPHDSAAGGNAGEIKAAPIAAKPDVRGAFWVLLAALYVVSVALVVRLLVTVGWSDRVAWYIVLFAVFFILFTVVWMFPRMPAALLHVILGVQCLVVLALLLLNPEYDYMVSLLTPLAYQAAVVFSGRVRWLWLGVIMVLIVAPLTAKLGFRGLGLAMTPLAVVIALAALAAASENLQADRAESQQTVAELEATHRRLERYAAEVESLAAVEERNRLVRELHDSVSQAMFAIQLATRSAQIMLDKEPQGVHVQLENLRDLTREALARMRGFIADLRQTAE